MTINKRSGKDFKIFVKCIVNERSHGVVQSNFMKKETDRQRHQSACYNPNGEPNRDR